jgi:MFS family permease
MAVEVGSMKSAGRIAAIAWLITAIFYFYQYVLRSAPSVMLPQLSEAYGLTAMSVASLAGIFYYGYSPFSLVAGAALDRWGPRLLVPMGAAVVGIGALLWATGNLGLASAGRFLQGAGGAFSIVGAVYIAIKSFPASRAATLIGATQMFGMAGGFAGQSLVGPAMAGGVPWDRFWIVTGCVGPVLAVILFALLPRTQPTQQSTGWVKESARSLATVFRNPQSIICGMISGLMFIPTTIFGLVWGVRYLQEAHAFNYGEAVMRSSTVPLGWIIGCPLMGFISDRIGRRKPVILAGAAILFACLAWILFGPTDLLPPYLLGLIAGVSSGAAMLPYSVIKEANPPELGGTSTGVINFLNFTFSALLAPAFSALMTRATGGEAERGLTHYQATFGPMLIGIAVAIGLTLLLRETGPAARRQVPLATPS